MLVLLEWVLVVAAAFCVGVQALVVVWKLRLAVGRVARIVSDNAVVAFFAKVAMFVYFAFVVPAIDRAIN